MKLAGIPDISQRMRLANSGWSESLIPQWEQALAKPETFMSLDLSKISFFTLLELVYMVSLIDRLATSEEVVQLDLDLLGNSDLRLIPADDFIAFKKKPPFNYKYMPSEVDYSADRYRLAGFLESLGVLDILNRPDRRTKVIYPGMNKEAAGFQ